MPVISIAAVAQWLSSADSTCHSRGASSSASSATPAFLSEVPSHRAGESQKDAVCIHAGGAFPAMRID